MPRFAVDGHIDVSRPPSRVDLGISSGHAAGELPLHIKAVGGSINIHFTRAEVPASDEAWELWEEAKSWLTDSSKYTAAGRHNIFRRADIPLASFSPEKIDMLFAAGVAREVDDDEFAAMLRDGRGVGTAILFPQEEHHGTPKHRERPIRWPVDVNNAIGREFLFAPPPASRDDVRGAALRARFGAA